LKGAFIQATNMGEMDWGVDDPVQIQLTIEYDYSILQY
jgi:hypothetical protein